MNRNPPPVSEQSATPDEAELNVAQRLKARIQEAKLAGFQIRYELLDDQSPGWCQVGTKRFAFLDLKSTTLEQLAQLNEILLDFRTKKAA